MNLIGKLVAWAVILGVIGVVVLLIRRITTKKKTLDKAEF